jgi:hypothetical protein
MGTALHAMTVRAEDPTDVDFNPGDPYDADLAAYTACLARYGLVSEFTEVHMVNDAYRAAGTADRIFRATLPLVAPDGFVYTPGSLILGDIKTGKKLDFSLPGYVIQCAIYADGEFYDVVEECRLPTPEIDRRWALLIYLPVGRAHCQLLWINVGLGLQGAYLSFQVKEWQNAWKAGRDGHEAVEVVAPEVPEVVSDQALLTFIADRVKVCGSHPQARAKLVRTWPAGVPTPRQGLSDPDHIASVLAVLDQIEAEFSLPFAPDPRIEHRTPSFLS